MSVERYDDPSFGPGQILVDVHAAGINFPDVLSIAGKYQVKTPLPFVAGNEAAGIVATVGSQVSRFKIGDKVIVTTRGGAFAERCIADELTSVPLPAAFSFQQGAAFAVTYGTSYHALKQSANLVPGESLLVLGAAGGVGIAAVEIGKVMGARVIAAASSTEKLDFAISAGADEAINYAERPLNETVKSLTDGNGVDVIVDPVGGELAEQALRATAWHGRYLVVGFASGEIPKFSANIALLKEASITGVWWGTWAAKNPQLQSNNMAEMARLIDQGKLSPRVTESYPLEDSTHAFKAITERQALGKVVLTMC